MIAFAMLYARTREEHEVEASAYRVKGVGVVMSGLGNNCHTLRIAFQSLSFSVDAFSCLCKAIRVCTSDTCIKRLMCKTPYRLLDSKPQLRGFPDQEEIPKSLPGTHFYPKPPNLKALNPYTTLLGTPLKAWSLKLGGSGGFKE